MVVVGLRGCGADVGEFPFEVFLQLLEAFKCDFELVWVGECGRVVTDGDVEEGDGSHGGRWVVGDVTVGLILRCRR